MNVCTKLSDQRSLCTASAFLCQVIKARLVSTAFQTCTAREHVASPCSSFACARTSSVDSAAKTMLDLTTSHNSVDVMHRTESPYKQFSAVLRKVWTRACGLRKLPCASEHFAGSASS